MSEALRLYAPTPSGTGGDPPRQTLAKLFEEITLPRLEEEACAPATIREYRTHLRRWAEFWQSGGPRHADSPSACSLEPPEAKQVTLDHLLSFRRWVGRQVACGNRTKNKHVGTLQAVLADGHKFHQVPGLLSLKPLDETTAAPKHYLHEEQLDALYRACEYAIWPGPNAPDRWRTLIVMWNFFGQRTQELVQLEPDHQPLTWGNFSWDPETPNPAGHAKCEHGWLSYTPWKQRRKKPQPLYLPLPDVVRAHLAVIKPRERLAPDRPVFDFPRCNKKFYPQWEAIVQAARLKPKGPAEEKYLPQHMRKTCATLLNKHRRGLGDLVIGHADRTMSKVQATHYDNPEEFILQGLLSFPYPLVFRQIFDRRQMTLF